MKTLLFALTLCLFSIASFAQGDQGPTIQGQINSLKTANVPKVTAITSGSATTLTQGVSPIWVVFNPASTLAAHTLTLPAYPVNGQAINITFGGTMTTGTAVTTLTIAANTGQSFIQTTAPTTGVVGNRYEYRYNTSIGKWYRFY